MAPTALDKLPTWLRQLTSYALLGCIAVGVDVLVYEVLTDALGIYPLVSNVVSASVGITTSFFLNRRFTFKVTDRPGRRYLMIFTSIENVEDNDITKDRFARAIEWLRTADLANVPLGRNEISGDDQIFANVMEFTTAAPAEKNYEAHRRYADVHCVISGAERIGIADIGEVELQGEFNEADDFGVYANARRESWVTLREGDIVVTPPCDAHKPGCSVNGPATLRKVCVKVLVD